MFQALSMPKQSKYPKLCLDTNKRNRATSINCVGHPLFCTQLRTLSGNQPTFLNRVELTSKFKHLAEPPVLSERPLVGSRVTYTHNPHGSRMSVGLPRTVKGSGNVQRRSPTDCKDVARFPLLMSRRSRQNKRPHTLHNIKYPDSGGVQSKGSPTRFTDVIRFLSFVFRHNKLDRPHGFRK